MRYSSIDVLRTIAIVIMVVVHFLENLSGVREWSPDGFGAPLFTLLTGVSYRLWLTSQEAKHRTSEEISKVTVRRGLFLFGLGFVFNTFVWLPDDLFTWDVLTFIGAAMIALNAIRIVPPPAAIVFISITTLLSPVLQTIADYPAYWTEGYFAHDNSLSDVLLGFLVTGYFPVFPWIAFPVAGFLVCPRIFEPAGIDAGGARMTWPVVTGLSLMAGSMALLGLRQIVPQLTGKLLHGWTMFPATSEYVLGTLGMALTLLSLCHTWLDTPSSQARFGRVLFVAETFSRYSLTVYLLHHVIHIWPLWIFGMVSTGEPSEYLGKALSYGVSLPLSVLFLIVCFFVLSFIRRRKISTVETLMRWLCD